MLIIFYLFKGLCALREYKKLVQCVILLSIFIVLTFLIKYYFRPFFIIVFLIMVCNPIYKFLCKLKIFNEKINAVLCIVIVNAVIFMTVIYIGNFFINGIRVDNIINSKNFNFENLDNLPLLKYIDLNDFSEKLKNGFMNFFNSDFIKKGAIYTTDSIFAYFVGNIAAYFILVDKYDIVNLAKILLTENKVKMIFEKFDEIKKIVIVETLLVVMTSIETILGFYILGINNSLMLGLLCGILDILPYVGTILVFMPLILYKIYERSYIIAFGLSALYILLQINRQILETKFMSSKLKIHPLLILVSLYVGLQLFGIIGIFMGPLYIVCAKEIIFSS